MCRLNIICVYIYITKNSGIHGKVEWLNIHATAAP